MSDTRGKRLGTAYDPARERAYHLAILTGGGISAWVVHDKADGSPLALAWAPGKEALSDTQLPHAPASVSFIAQPEWSTLVPDGALEPGNEAAHLALVHGRTPHGDLRDEPIAAVGATCIYTQDTDATRAVLQRYPHARPMAMQALLVRGALARSKEGPVVLVHRGAERTDVAVADEGRLLLSNSFPVHTAHDLLYFVLNAAERTGVIPAQATILPCGTHITADECRLLERYFARTGTLTGMADLPSSGRWMAALEQFACV